MNPARFRSARSIDDEVPDQFGLYAIRASDVDFLPEPCRTIARDRGSDLNYVGEATRQTPKVRFLRNELRGRVHGTFFRSIGAVLGYGRVPGSLVGRANQRNFRFCPADSAAVVGGINQNLLVSWVEFDDGVHVADFALIKKHGALESS